LNTGAYAKRTTLLLAGALALGAAAGAPAGAQELDIVVLRNGNPVEGEVKSLRRGNLSFDTEEMDLVDVDWDDIAFLTSAQLFEVETVDGRRLFGTLATADTAMLVVVGDQRSDTLDFQDVVEMGPIESGFLARTNGFVYFGTNVARANRLASLQLKGRFAYRGPNWGFDVNSDTYLQRQESVDEAGNTSEQRTRRASAQLTLNRFLGARWVASGAGRVEMNEELNLDSRLLALLGGQFLIVRNQGLELSVGAGAALNDEQFTGEEKQTSGEALLSLGFDVFDVGDVDIFTSLDTFTNPTDGGRLRVNFDGRVSWEIFNDFYLGFTATNRYDSAPPSEGAEKHDFQYGVTIGWSWS